MINMKLPSFVSCVGWIVLCEAVGGVGAFFTTPSVSGWYVTLEKPFLQPPSWIFAPVWTLLYALMGISIFLVLQRVKAKKDRVWFIQLFGAQLFFNFVWSIFFFGFHAPGLALFDIVFLLGTIIVLIFDFKKYSLVASLLLVPYLLWVSFATYLNFMIWWLN